MNLTLADLMRGMSEEKNEPLRPLPEAQVATLMEEFAFYAQPCPFKPGDLIRPRATSAYNDGDVPHMVMEVLSEPIRTFKYAEQGDVFSHAFGQRLDIRVAVIRGDEVVCFMQESWRHERYTGPMPSIS